MADEIIIVVKAKDEFSSTLGNFGNIMTGIKSAIDLAGDAFRAFAGFAMEGLDAIASYERMAASLETLVAKELLATGAAENMAAALRMSGEGAEELLEWNQQLAINSPFTAEGVNNALRMAMAYGFTVTEAQRLTEALIDFAAGSGATEASMEAIARALGQISATGKVTGGDMLQLVNAGLPVVEILAEGFGVTTEKLMEMRSQGLLPATEAIEYITTYLEENFAGAAQRQATTWAGLQGTFEDLKQMGLREFFGGLFDALQPLAVELSNFLQTEGMDKLAEWGNSLGIFTQAVIDLLSGNKLYTLGAALQNLEGTDSIFYALGTSIRIFQQNIDDGETKRDAFIEALEKFEELSGKDLSILIDVAMGEVPTEQLNQFLETLDENLADAIENFNWSGAGQAFVTALVKSFTKESEEDMAWYDTIPAVISIKMIAGLLSSDSVRALASGIGRWFSSAWDQVQLTFNMDRLNQWGQDVATPAVQGFFQGLQEGLAGLPSAIGAWVQTYVIGPFKREFGIASPSSLFMGFGQDIIMGLVMGWFSAVGTFFAIIQSFVQTVLTILSPILDIFGIDIGGTTGTGGGSIPGSSFYIPPGMEDPNAPGSTGSGSVVNNFYGPVYFGDMGQLGYDCPSPHPLMTASEGSLLQGTFSP